MSVFYPKRSKFLLIGNTGSGKSALAMYFLREALNTSRCLIIDSNFEIASLLGLRTAFYVHDWNFNNPCIVPNRMNAEELDLYIRYARRFKNFVLFIDDLDNFADQSGYAGRELPILMSNARHQGIATIVCNKTPNMINSKVVINASNLFMFALDARYLKLFDEWRPTLNFNNPDTGSPIPTSRLAQMPQYTFALFSPRDAQDPNATSPKRFEGYYRLPAEMAQKSA